MTPEQRYVVEVQVRAWLGAMRIAWVKRYGVERGECPVPAWEGIAQQDRNILITAQVASNRAGGDANIKRLQDAQNS